MKEYMGSVFIATLILTFGTTWWLQLAHPRGKGAAGLRPAAPKAKFKEN
jgi:hypothetical protein